MKHRIVFSVMLGVSLCTASLDPVLAKEELPQVTEEGLHLVQDSELAIVYAKPDVDLGIYNRVQLLDATVAFRKNWKRDQNRSSLKISSRDMERIKSDLAELFDQVFAEKLSEAGYELADGPGEDVLIVRPAIVNLDVTAPDVSSPGRSYQISDSAGEMTLYVELYDGLTSDLLGKAMDRQHDRRSAFYTWQTKVSNRAAARRILQGWADVLVAALDRAHEAAGGASE